MREQVTIAINGKTLVVNSGTTAAAAIMMSGFRSRISVSHEPRGPLCGMGTCFECRAVIDGVPHRRSCQIVCAAGMQIQTNV